MQLTFLRSLQQKVRIYFSRPSFHDTFMALTKKYGLEEKADMRKDYHGGHTTITLFRIIRNKKQRSLPLPPGFIDEVKKLVSRYYRGKSYKFMVGEGRTLGEMRRYMKELEWHYKNS